jgi:hypothetical protein
LDKSRTPVGVCPPTPTGISRDRLRRECGYAAAHLAHRHDNPPPHQAAEGAPHKPYIRKAGVPFDSVWDCSHPIRHVERVVGFRWHGEPRPCKDTSQRSLTINGAAKPTAMLSAEAAPGSCARDWRGAQQPRSEGTARPGAEGPERESAEPRKARSA